MRKASLLLLFVVLLVSGFISAGFVLDGIPKAVFKHLAVETVPPTMLPTVPTIAPTSHPSICRGGDHASGIRPGRGTGTSPKANAPGKTHTGFASQRLGGKDALEAYFSSLQYFFFNEITDNNRRRWSCNMRDGRARQMLEFQPDPQCLKSDPPFATIGKYKPCWVHGEATIPRLKTLPNNTSLLFIGDSLVTQQYFSATALVHAESPGGCQKVAASSFYDRIIYHGAKNITLMHKRCHCYKIGGAVISAGGGKDEKDYPCANENRSGPYCDLEEIFHHSELQWTCPDFVLISPGHSMGGAEHAEFAEQFGLALLAEACVARGLSHVIVRSALESGFRERVWHEGGHCSGAKFGATTFNTSGVSDLHHSSLNRLGLNAALERWAGTVDAVSFLDVTWLARDRVDAHVSSLDDPLNKSLGVDERHPNGHHDCLHWCLPGVPDWFNVGLVETINAVLEKVDENLAKAGI